MQKKSRFSIALSGMPKSFSACWRIRLTGGSCLKPARTGFGIAFVRLLSTRIANCGAWPAFANVLSAWPTLVGSGSVRWKVSPGSSSSGRCAMWSIALATKSTGTMFVCPPSGPASGNHCGSALRSRWSSLKK